MAAVDTGVDVELMSIVAEEITLDDFAPYGHVLAPEGDEWAPGGMAEVYSCGLLDADVPVEFLVARAPRRPLTVAFLERHHQLAQTFVSLNGAPFIIVVGRANDAGRDEVVPIDELRAFIVPGDKGVTLSKRVWHEAPFPLVDDTVLLTTSHASLNVALRASNTERTAIDEHDIDRRDLTEASGSAVHVTLP